MIPGRLKERSLVDLRLEKVKFTEEDEEDT
jgi:hypothetical protein